MKSYSLTLLSDDTLLHDAPAVHAHERSNTALGLAHIAEIDFRKLYRQAGHPSIHSYCLVELNLSPQAAFKRIHAARAARRFPAIFVSLAEGRIHLSAIVAIAASLNEENAEELIGAAENRSKAEIQRFLSERKGIEAPSEDLALEAGSGPQLSPGKVECSVEPNEEVAKDVAQQLVTPDPLLAVQTQYPVRLTMSQEMVDDLRHAQELLGHQLLASDIAAVLHRALRSLIRELEKRKLGMVDRPRCKRKAIAGGRYIPAQVRRAVWRRDEGQCAYVSENGRRCPARKMLEFDHVVPVARGGLSTEDNVRVLCRAHNQYVAEMAFGVDLMAGKRLQGEAMRIAAAKKKAATDQVARCMRRLGFNSDESRRAAEHADAIEATDLEVRVRAALAYLVPPRRSPAQPTTAVAIA